MTTSAVIEVRNLRYRYPGRQEPALRGLDFRVERGEVFGFLGPSGAGKSTTQKLLIRLLEGFEGEARVLGRPLQDWDAGYFQRVGVSFELPSHYLKLTARENLSLFASLYDGPIEDAEDLMERLALAGDMDTRLSQYSKGMAMRLNVLRAVLHRPELLFLDEPTSGMDPVNGRRVKELIRDQRRAGRTVFLTTHDMATADELCDRVAFIVDGQIPVIDAPRALKLRAGRRRLAVELRREGRLERGELDLDAPSAGADLAALLAEGADIETIHTQEASLEQVFVDVTGRSLR